MIEVIEDDGNVRRLHYRSLRFAPASEMPMSQFW